MIFHYAIPDVSADRKWSSLAHIGEVKDANIVHSPPPEVLNILTKKRDLFILVTEDDEYGRVVGFGRMHAKMYYSVTQEGLRVNGRSLKKINGLGLPRDIIKVAEIYDLSAKFVTVLVKAEDAALLTKPTMIALGIRLINTARSHFDKSPRAKVAFDEFVAGVRRPTMPNDLESTHIGKAVKSLLGLEYRYYAWNQACLLMDLIVTITGDRKSMEAEFKRDVTLPAIVAGLAARG